MRAAAFGSAVLVLGVASLITLAVKRRGYLFRRSGVAIRAALDIGSGQHKLLIASVDLHAKRIVARLHSEQTQVLLNHALLQSSGSELSKDVLDTSREVLASYRDKAHSLGATEISGVSTAVFRRAKNGEAYLRSVSRELGLGLRLVSQTLEGELGYLAGASGVADHERTGLVTWDSGGGSFQVSSRVQGKLRVWEGGIGDSDVTRALLTEVQRREFRGSVAGARSSPNPVSLSEAQALSKLLAARLPTPPYWLREALSHDASLVAGIGERTSIFALATGLVGKSHFTAAEVWAAAELCFGSSDAALRATHELHDEEDMVVPKLLLLHTVMLALEIGEVRYVRTMGSCEGVLLCNDLWA